MLHEAVSRYHQSLVPNCGLFERWASSEPMPYHRSEWIWYLAQLVVESKVEGLAEPILLIESILLRASSPEAAYEKALSICASSEHGYRNKFGAPVMRRYLGIHDIDDLQTEQLEDEQPLQVRVVPSSTQSGAGRLIRAKDELSIFGGEDPSFLHLN
jgi:hypothetical protein